MSIQPSRPLWIEIDTRALRENYRAIKNHVGADKKILALVKAEAYGHGALRVAKILEEEGVDYFGVAFLNEAIELREKGIKKPILILGWTPTEDFARALEYDFTLTIFDKDEAKLLNFMAEHKKRKITIHIKLDTGLSRLGFALHKQTLKDIAEIMEMENLCVEGIYSHFAKSDEKNKESSLLQLDRFNRFILDLKKLTEREVPLKHMANSGAIIDLPESHLDMVRPGIILYGGYPSDEVKKEKINLKPILELKARIARVEKQPRGTEVSYGGTYITERETVLATVPIGYEDGLNRALSNKGYILFRGVKLPIVGRVCMDQCVVDAGRCPDIRKGDLVTIIGSDDEGNLSADEIAGMLGTINYEVFCALSARIPRYYL